MKQWRLVPGAAKREHPHAFPLGFCAWKTPRARTYVRELLKTMVLNERVLMFMFERFTQKSLGLKWVKGISLLYREIIWLSAVWAPDGSGRHDVHIPLPFKGRSGGISFQLCRQGLHRLGIRATNEYEETGMEF
jgi:hypothetical protein